MTRSHRPADLIRRTAKALSVIYEAEGGELTRPQFQILAVLQAGHKSSCDLVYLTGMDRSTLYALLPRMRAAGMVQSAPGVSVGPGPIPTIWKATADGRAAWKTSEAALWKAEKLLVETLGVRERGAFLSALERTAFARPQP